MCHNTVANNSNRNSSSSSSNIIVIIVIKATRDGLVVGPVIDQGLQHLLATTTSIPNNVNTLQQP